ncbi:MAG: sulfotransferase family 2 domain-containing protein [Pseudomonadota bacterium]
MSPTRMMRQATRVRLRREYPVLLPELKVAYVAAPKNACTTLKMSLYRLRFGEEFNIINLRGRDVFHVHHVFPSHAFDPSGLDGIPVEGRFCVVRDPIDRFVSFYCNRILYHDDLAKSGPLLTAQGLKTRPDVNELVADLDKYMKAARLVRHHVLPQSYFLGDDASRYGLVADVRELDRVRTFLSDRVGRDVGPFPRYQEGGNDRKDEVRTALSTTSRATLEAFYAEDYRVWR